MTKHNKQLFFESTPGEVLVETGKTVGQSTNAIILSGIFLEAGKVNNNQRWYEPNDMARAVKDFQKLIKAGKALAELEHPDEKSPRSDEIDLTRACARILSLESTGNNQWFGRSVVTASDPKAGIRGTPAGDLLTSLLQYGTKFGWSSRGFGDIDESTNCVTNLEIIAIDCVLKPSIHYDSKVEGLDKIVKMFTESEERDRLINAYPSTEALFHVLGERIKTVTLLSESEKQDKVSHIFNNFIQAFVNQ